MMQHLYDAHQRSGSSPVDWLAVVAAYPADQDFQRWVDEHGEDSVQKRAAQISGLMPL